MKSTTTQRRAGTLRDRLKRHFLTCSATAAGALAWSDRAQADIIHFSSANDPNLPIKIAANIYGVYVNPQTGLAANGPGQGGVPTPFINIYALTGTKIDNIYTNPATVKMVTTTSGGSTVAALAAGTQIGAGSNFAGTNIGLTGVDAATANTTAFFGFEFVNKVTNQTDFGWIRVAGGSSSNDKTVIDFAYENSGGSIATGQTATVPEPSTLTLGLLALGAGGLVALRRRRAATVAEAVQVS
jgi:MYXO-CTERM domain-containing protein